MVADITTLFSDHALSEGDKPAPGAAISALAEGPHLAKDRRISRRMLDLWARSARGLFPSWCDIKQHDLGSDGNWIFVVDIAESVGFPYYVYLGANLAKLSDVYLSGDTDWTQSVLDKAASCVNDAVEASAPCFYENTLTLWDGRPLFFRCMTAPLSENGTDITHVLGVVSGRLDIRRM